MSKPDPKKANSSKILAVVGQDLGFHFCFADQNYSMVTATSLSDFVEKLNGIDDRAILFHYPRGDFQAWIRDTVGDRVLADKMCFIQQGISGEKLRQELLKMVQTRISELKGPKKEVFPSSQCNKDGLCLS
jgi:hypothetical protein